jgi:hypothetical protein
MSKNILLGFGLVCFAVTSCLKAQDTPSKNFKIQESSVSEVLAFLSSDALEGRETGTEGIAKAAVYIEDFFRKYEVSPYFETYKDTLTNFDGIAYNIVGVSPGNHPVLKDEFIIIGAHYDHIGIVQNAVDGDNIANGANDNASGVTAVLQLAAYFSQNKNHERSIIFALFSGEEKGLLGSRHLAKRLKQLDLNLYTMVNFEMIGVPMQKPFTSYITGYNMTTMADKFNEYTGKNTIGFLPLEAQYQLFKASDNYPFYLEFKVPAQTVCTFDFENFEYYHHPFDEFERMDIEHMTNYIQDMAVGFEKMANTPTKEVVIK